MEHHLGVASAAARLAGSLLVKSFGSAQLTASTARDVKLAEDERAQAVIVGHLTRHASLPILTEEAGWIGNPPTADSPYWVVDPLDGSFNFLHGIPLCCVAIALCRGMTPLAGCVHDFLRDETLVGAPGLGLSCNGAAVAAQDIFSGMLATGVPAGGRQDGSGFGTALQRWRKLRMLGSAALSLSWVARGRMDAYHEDGIRWWDVAAGLALVSAAGGSFEVRAASGEVAGPCASPDRPLEVRAWRAGVAPGGALGMEVGHG